MPARPSQSANREAKRIIPNAAVRGSCIANHDRVVPPQHRIIERRAARLGFARHHHHRSSLNARHVGSDHRHEGKQNMPEADQRATPLQPARSPRQ
jgi:hypothetical protein